MISSSVLLVEGRDDEHVFYALLKHHQIPQRFEVINKDGIDRLIGSLPVELKRSDLEHLGLVVDANTNIHDRWTSLGHILSRAGSVDMPKHPDPNGTVFILERPDRTVRVGIWLMPDNRLPGMLESFIEFLVPADDVLWPRATVCVEEIPPDERRFSPSHQMKANVHTWLAWQREPGSPLGQAITKRYLDADAPHAQQLIDWVRRLFELV